MTNYKWESIWKEMVVAWLKYYPDIYLERLSKGTGRPGQYSRSPGQHSNWASQKYKSTVLPLDQTCFMTTLYNVENHNIVACLLKARIVESEKQPLPGNSRVTHNNGVNVGSSVFYTVRANSYVTQ
jgi:hypothetical protein